MPKFLFKPVPFGQPVRLGQWGLVPVVSHSPLVGCGWPRHRSPRTSDATSATAPSPPDSADSARGRVPCSGEWVGAERGVQRPVSPHRPLPPYVRLSHLYGDRLKVSFNPSASHWHPQEHSPALASSEMNSRVPFKLRPFPRAHGSPVLHGQDVTPGEYYDRMPPPVRVVLVLLGALSPD